MATNPQDTELVRRNEGNFTILDDRNITGGLHTVASNADMQAIQSALRKAGMLCWVQVDTDSQARMYQLQADLETWSVYSGGGGGGLPAFAAAGDAIFQQGTGDSATFVVRQITQDDIAPAFSVSLSPSFSTTLELGQLLVNPAFTASYSQPINAATLADGTDTQNLALPATSFGYNQGALPARQYTKTTHGSQGWTLSGTNTSGTTRTGGATATWYDRHYSGVSTIPGTFNSAFVLSLTGTNALGTSAAGSYTFGNGDSTKYWFLVVPVADTQPTTFTSGGFTFPMTLAASSVAVVNGFSLSVPCNIYQSSGPVVLGATVVVA